MKIREGFVSNSSSSSFVIATNLTLEETLNKALNFNSKHKFVISLEKDLKAFFLENCKNIPNKEYKNYKEVYIGFASNEVIDPIEYLVCNYLEIIEKNDEYMFEKQAGY